MKKYKFLFFLLILGVVFTQCTIEPQDNTEGAMEGGQIIMDNASFNYVVGDGSAYDFSMLVLQNEDFPVAKVQLYKSALITVDGVQQATNEVLAEEITVDGTDPVNITSSGYDYAALIDGLTVGGNPLPASDGELSIGDRFIFRIVSVLENGNEFQQAYQVNLTVSTRFAGKYRFVEGVYYRLGVLTSAGDYWFDEYQFESVDAVTYKMIGMCAWLDNELYFQILEDGTIHYPLEWNGAGQLLNGAPLITCVENPADMTNVNCGQSDYVVKDDVNGKDRLYMSFGYFTPGSGPREFYQVMEKL